MAAAAGQYGQIDTQHLTEKYPGLFGEEDCSLEPGKYQQIFTQNQPKGAPSLFVKKVFSVNMRTDFCNEIGLGSERHLILLAGKSIKHVGKHVVIAAPTVVMHAGESITLDSPDPEHPVKLLEIQTLVLTSPGEIIFHNVMMTSDKSGIQGSIMAKKVIFIVDQESLSSQDRTLIELVQSLAKDVVCERKHRDPSEFNCC